MSKFSYTPPLFDLGDDLIDLKIQGKKVICTFQISEMQLDHLKKVSEYQKVTVSALIRTALDYFIFKGLK